MKGAPCRPAAQCNVRRTATEPARRRLRRPRESHVLRASRPEPFHEFAVVALGRGDRQNDQVNGERPGELQCAVSEGRKGGNARIPDIGRRERDQREAEQQRVVGPDEPCVDAPPRGQQVAVIDPGSADSGAFRSSTMIVMMTAKTPSEKPGGGPSRNGPGFRPSQPSSLPEVENEKSRSPLERLFHCRAHAGSPGPRVCL